MTEKELARGAARRLAIIRHAQEVTGNVAATLPVLRVNDSISGVLPDVFVPVEHE